MRWRPSWGQYEQGPAVRPMICPARCLLSIHCVTIGVWIRNVNGKVALPCSLFLVAEESPNDSVLGGVRFRTGVSVSVSNAKGRISIHQQQRLSCLRETGRRRVYAQPADSGFPFWK